MRLEVATQGNERAGEIDAALLFPRKPLVTWTNGNRSFVQRALNCPSRAEVEEGSKRVQVAITVDRTVTDLTRAAVMQSIRAGHDEAQVFRVSRLAGNFARAGAMEAERLRTLELATKLLDIGYMGVSDRLLRKPSALSIVERRIVDEHAALSAELLLSTQLRMIEPCVPIVRFHHERWDGTGPTSRAGHDIPLEARMASLCSAFDALTHDRPWRPALTADAALRTLESEAGSRFDPELCRSFISWVKGELLHHPHFDAYYGAEADETAFMQFRRRIRQIAETGAA
jgi:putative two-component system response regulator